MNYPELCMPDIPYSEWMFIVGDQYNFIFQDVFDVAGVLGQGPTANPKSLFGNHQVVVVGNTIFDPSYGTKYGTGGQTGNAMLAQIDDAMAGYALAFLESPWISVNEMDVGVDLNGDWVVTDTWVDVAAIVMKSNPSGNQLRLAAPDHPYDLERP